MGNYIYMVRFVSGYMPSTAIERNEGIFSSMEKAEEWIRESYEICDDFPKRDRLYIEKHPVDRIPSFDESLEVKEIKITDLLNTRKISGWLNPGDDGYKPPPIMMNGSESHEVVNHER